MNNIEYLKANRGQVIALLTKAFKYEDVTLKDAMTALVNYVELEYSTTDLAKCYMDSVINEMIQEWKDGKFNIDTNGNANEAVSNYEEKQRIKQKQLSNLHN